MMCEKYTNERKKTLLYCISFNYIQQRKKLSTSENFDPVHKTSCVVHLDSVMGMQYMQFQPIYEVIES